VNGFGPDRNQIALHVSRREKNQNGEIEIRKSALQGAQGQPVTILKTGVISIGHKTHKPKK
jgi:hypothetical protein